MLFSCYFNMTAPCERAWRLRLRPGQGLAVHKRMSMILNAPDGFPAVYRRFRPFGWRGRIQSCRRINHLALQPFLPPFKNGENGENGIGGLPPPPTSPEPRPPPPPPAPPPPPPPPARPP